MSTPPLDRLAERWEEDAERLRQYGCDRVAETCDRHADELEAVLHDQTEASAQTEPSTSADGQDWGWREKLWIVPSETRIGTTELAEALGRNENWIYRRTQQSADDPIPHRKLDGSLVFRVGEVRAWLRKREDVLAAGPSAPATTGQAGLEVVDGGADA